MAWLYKYSSAFLHTMPTEELEAQPSWPRAIDLLILGLPVIVSGAEILAQGAQMVLSTWPISKVFLGMTVVASGESLEETTRPGWRCQPHGGHRELAWGNVVGTVIILLALNLGVISLIRPLAAEPLVLLFHAPYLIGCTILVAVALLSAKRLGRTMGAILLGLYLIYLTVNLYYIVP